MPKNASASASCVLYDGILNILGVLSIGGTKKYKFQYVTMSRGQLSVIL